MEDIKEQKMEKNIDKNDEKIEIEKEIISNNNTNNDIEILENINSPIKIQQILHFTTPHFSKKGFELQKDIIQSLLSINNTFIDILDDDLEKHKYNPVILTQNKKNDLYKLNFEEVNVSNNFLNKKIKQYHELYDKISEYNRNKSEKQEKVVKQEKSEENSEKTEKKKKIEKINENIKNNLYFIQHPLIKIFEEEKKIDIKELKNEIKNEYLNKMKDNTNYKHIQNLLDLQMLLNDNSDINENNDNEDNDDNDNDNEDEDDANQSYNGLASSNSMVSNESNGNDSNASNNLENQNENNNENEENNSQNQN